MTTTPSIPVVQGSGKTSLRLDGDALLLSRPREEARIPLAAVGRVLAEGRSVAVELTAPEGAVPSVHRIDGTSEAAATMFAAAVNAVLPGVAGRDATADGAGLVEARTLSPNWRARKLRAIKRGSYGLLGALVIAGVLVCVLGDPFVLIVLVIGGVVGTVGLAAGANALANWYREWRLVRHGVTTFAAEDPREPGTYLYVDPAGLVRHVFTWAGGTAVKVSYDPRDPGNVVLPRVALMRRVELCAGLFFVVLGLGAYACAITMVVLTILDPTALDGPA
ncbi:MULTISPECIES: hypothetical protein [unclassified Streptomyces]|uniref:hypothetical protein n=1 Tax=unclassified Streptomyces TaxID=2593676 RepID=UPI0006AE78CE|nr:MULTISPECIES: hypothetical protein [unclassified Streptomyces]KOX30859.1 hypothetical protein ADL06_11930 [Streptomyces sp. NRRL F-6491]KOX39725.1 hypothetical protein ADL08_24455 [Streptomyces sp. NRRL F-6492]